MHNSCSPTFALTTAMLSSTTLRTGELRSLRAPILPLPTCDVSRAQQIGAMLPCFNPTSCSSRGRLLSLCADSTAASSDVILQSIPEYCIDPKPGYAGSTFSVHVYDRTRQTTVRVEVESPATTHNYYVFQVVWFDTTTILLRLMNREQTTEDVAFCDAASGSCQLAVTNVAPRGWLEQSALLPVPARNAFLQVQLVRS